MKTVLITGCSSGFGRRMVSDFLGAGWRVHAGVRGVKRLGAEFADEQARFGEQLQLVELDVTLEADRAAVAARFRSERLDCLINNAGYGQFGALEDLSEAQLRRQFEVNFFGLALLTTALLPALRERAGRIINISSVFGFSGFPLTSAYCASKFAVEGLSESLRIELAPFGVQVAIVEPGGHRTKFGARVEWGSASFAATSSYTRATEGYRRFKDQLATRPHPQTADQVSLAVLRLASRRRMPARVVCGKDAKGMAWLRHSPVGAWLGERLVSLLYRRKFLGGPVE